MPTKSTDKFLARAVTEGQEPTVEGYDGPLNGEVYAIRSGDSVFGIAGADGQAEAARKQAEIERQADETQRAEQQSANNAAQQQNDEAQQENDSKQDLNDQSQAANNEQQLANNKAAQGVYAVVLGDGEYDPETRKPTIDGEVGKIYLVPTGDGLTNATWMWVDGAWAGAGTPSTIETITDEQVAEVVSGGSPQGNEMLDLSGLSSLWSKGAPASLAPSATIAPGTDLDTITTVGSYACSDASGVTNTPEGVTGAFNLYVYETQGGG